MQTTTLHDVISCHVTNKRCVFKGVSDGSWCTITWKSWLLNFPWSVMWCNAMPSNVNVANRRDIYVSYNYSCTCIGINLPKSIELQWDRRILVLRSSSLPPRPLSLGVISPERSLELSPPFLAWKKTQNNNNTFFFIYIYIS